jgi:cytochrome c oxidase assembly protein subunit 15
VHFVHRVGAVLVTAAVIATAAYVWSHHRRNRALARPALALVGLVAFQFILGALTVLSRRDVAINSAHVVCGALVLAASLVLSLRSWRARFDEGGVAVPARVSIPPGGTIARSASGANA